MTGAPISIHEATPQTADLLACLHAEIFPQDSWNTAWMEKLLANPVHRALILAVGDAPCGLIVTGAVAGEAEILTIGILPDRRRQGLAAGLLAAAEERLAGAGTELLHLEVAATNSAAIAFYEKAGFSRSGIRRRYYSDGADALTMVKKLR